MLAMKRYDPAKIESKWRQIWQEAGLYEVDLKKANKPFYNLMMFPYPSAEGLHVGNMYAFTGADVYGRFMRMQGQDVLEPIGLDGFGIHSENYAIKVGDHPVSSAQKTQKRFYGQLAKIGNGFAWSRRLETYDPAYYHWTQWIFVQMFKNGLAYRKEAKVNWCPSCKTVLADEQVISGQCERCGSEVGKKKLTQWFFRITKYADRLLDNLEKIDWSERVKVAQRNWIGRSEGIIIDYPVVGQDLVISCFTKFPETNFGATFIVLGPEHPDVLKLTKPEQLEKVKAYVGQSLEKTEIERLAEGREKTGVFTGTYVYHRLTNRKLPIWVTDFVLGEVGTGAVVGVPGHDIRDFEFAQKFALPIIRVIRSFAGDDSPVDAVEKVIEEGVVVNSEFLDGMKAQPEAREAVKDWLEEKGWGKRTITYHLRDWLISRQRYWGPPIPMICCDHCAKKGKSWFDTGEAGEYSEAQNSNDQRPTTNDSAASQWAAGWYPVPENDLPVELPFLENFKPAGTGEAPLAQLKDWIKVKCPGCGQDAWRETEVSDTFLDSAWYFLRYPSVDNEKEPWGQEVTKKWLPVEMYIGGAEHSVLHLLYSRFLTMVFCDLGLLSFEEPFTRFYAHGLLIREGTKMSKSKGNVIVPDEYIDRYGADTLRTYLMFLGPFDQGGDFRDTGIAGTFRFMRRVWELAHKAIVGWKDEKGSPTGKKNLDHQHLVHKTIRDVTNDIRRLRYNTAIAKIRLYSNHLERFGFVSRQEIEVLLKLLAPFAPFITEELWSELGNQNSIHKEPWPKFDPKLAASDKATIVVQVNGKLRGTFAVERGTADEDLVDQAKKMKIVAKHLQGKVVKHFVVVPDKLINFVV